MLYNYILILFSLALVPVSSMENRPSTDARKPRTQTTEMELQTLVKELCCGPRKYSSENSLELASALTEKQFGIAWQIVRTFAPRFHHSLLIIESATPSNFTWKKNILLKQLATLICQLMQKSEESGDTSLLVSSCTALNEFAASGSTSANPLLSQCCVGSCAELAVNLEKLILEHLSPETQIKLFAKLFYEQACSGLLRMLEREAPAIAKDVDRYITVMKHNAHPMITAKEKALHKNVLKMIRRFTHALKTLSLGYEYAQDTQELNFHSQNVSHYLQEAELAYTLAVRTSDGKLSFFNETLPLVLSSALKALLQVRTEIAGRVSGASHEVSVDSLFSQDPHVFLGWKSYEHVRALQLKILSEQEVERAQLEQRKKLLSLAIHTPQSPLSVSPAKREIASPIANPLFKADTPKLNPYASAFMPYDTLPATANGNPVGTPCSDLNPSAPVFVPHACH